MGNCLREIKQKGVCVVIRRRKTYAAALCRALAVQVEPTMRRSVLADVLTVHGAGKSIVFTQTKRDADEVAAGVSQSIPCEVASFNIIVVITDNNNSY